MPESSTGDRDLSGGTIDDKIVDGVVGSENPDANTGAPPADSPSAEPKDDNKSTSLVDAVRAALDGGKEQSSGSGEGEGQNADALPAEGDKPKEGDEELGELTDEELGSYKPKTQRRFKQLDAANKTLTAKVAEYEPQVTALRAIQSFAETNNLSREDMNAGFEILRLVRNDPVKAYEALTPIYQNLRALVGDVIPDDLQSQVTAGKITPEHAKELSRLRAEKGVNSTVQQQTQERTQQTRQQEQVRQTEQLKVDVGSAITKWESDWKASDPDYSLKASRVNSEIERILLKEAMLARDGQPNKLPTSVAEAVRLASEVKKQVEKEIARFVPNRRNVPINHINGSGAPQGSKPAPKSLHEAIAQAVGRS